jgi:hypothetical protein
VIFSEATLMTRPAGHASSAIQWGDFPAWALAVIALAALIAAVLAYRKEADAARKLAEQVDLQREQLKDQQEANRKQAEVMNAQLREMAQRAQTYERQQADHINLKWARNTDDTYLAILMNESSRPIRNAVCQIEEAPGQGLQHAIRVGPFKPSTRGKHNLFATGGSRVPLIRISESYGFEFALDYGHPGAQVTARFTDDAGLYWQIDHDLHLAMLDSRDDW